MLKEISVLMLMQCHLRLCLSVRPHQEAEVASLQLLYYQKISTKSDWRGVKLCDLRLQFKKQSTFTCIVLYTQIPRSKEPNSPLLQCKPYAVQGARIPVALDLYYTKQDLLDVFCLRFISFSWLAHLWWEFNMVKWITKENKSHCPNYSRNTNFPTSFTISSSYGNISKGELLKLRV